MNKILKSLAALLLVALFAVPALSAWNLRQKSSGGAVWIDQNSVEVPVGSAGLTVRIPDISTASTSFVVSHKSGNIVRIWHVLGGQITGTNSLLSFTIVSDTGTQTAVSGGSTLTIPAVGSATANIASVTYVPGSYQPGLSVTQGYAIGVRTDGGSSTTSESWVTIVIE